MADSTHPTCSTCRWWGKPYGDEYSNEVQRTMGRCARTPHSEDMEEWVDDDGFTSRRILPEYADRTACAIDASGYSAALLTKHNHYCAMHQPVTVDMD